MLAITRIPGIEVLFSYISLLLYWGQENHLIHQGLCYIEQGSTLLGFYRSVQGFTGVFKHHKGNEKDSNKT